MNLGFSPCRALSAKYSSRGPLCLLAAAAFALTLSACGGGGGGKVSSPPITVALVNPNVVVSQDGTPVIVNIQIASTSETALVSVTNLPGGV
jgi:uncharacterized membrane protein YfcA